MKSFFLVMAMILSISNYAKAEGQCAFGESTWDLGQELESEDSGKVWYQSEHVSLSNPQRLKGLTDLEREMILSSLHENDGGNADQVLLDFGSADGYIQYFSSNKDRRFFALVASYPGDNEFGVIYEMTKDSLDTAQVLRTVAVVSDGDFEECQIQRSEIK